MPKKGPDHMGDQDHIDNELFRADDVAGRILVGASSTRSSGDLCSVACGAQLPVVFSMPAERHILLSSFVVAAALDDQQ